MLSTDKDEGKKKMFSEQYELIIFMNKMLKMTGIHIYREINNKKLNCWESVIITHDKLK